MGLKDLHLYILRGGYHPEFVEAHNLLVGKFLELQDRITELENANRDSTEAKTD